MSEDEFYTEFKGQTIIPNAKRGKDGNPEGSKYDLGKDGAFKEYVIAIYCGYNGEGCTYNHFKEALKQKGFTIVWWGPDAPPIEEFRATLKKACQLWIISALHQQLTPEHLVEIEAFFNSGRGLMLFSDNDPAFADTNFVSEKLFHVKMSGNVPGQKNLTPRTKDRPIGYIQHLITTGLDRLYEGYTICFLPEESCLKNIMWGTDGKINIGVFEKDGKRAVLDGGFTKLWDQFWDTVGTERYIKNIAVWLANVERHAKNMQLKPFVEFEGELNAGEETVVYFYDTVQIQDLRFDFTWEGKATAHITVFDPTMATLENKSSNTSPFKFELIQAKPGRYGVKLKITDATSGEYKFKIRIGLKKALERLDNPQTTTSSPKKSFPSAQLPSKATINPTPQIFPPPMPFPMAQQRTVRVMILAPINQEITPIVLSASSPFLFHKGLLLVALPHLQMLQNALVELQLVNTSQITLKNLVGPQLIGQCYKGGPYMLIQIPFNKIIQMELPVVIGITNQFMIGFF